MSIFSLIFKNNILCRLIPFNRHQNFCLFSVIISATLSVLFRKFAPLLWNRKTQQSLSNASYI